MKKEIFHFLILCTYLNQFITSANYIMSLYRTDVPYFNQTLAGISMNTRKINRTHFATDSEYNFTIDLSKAVTLKAQVYEFLNNEFRPFAITIQKDWCNYLENEYKIFFYKDHSKPGDHMWPPRCPTVAGIYYVKNFIPSVSYYPLNLPMKHFYLRIDVCIGETTIFTCRYYVKLDRDAFIRQQLS